MRIGIGPPRLGRFAGEAVAGGDVTEVSFCDHRASAGWQLKSTHQTSSGTVTYARCRCGAWLVLLDGEHLAASVRLESHANLASTSGG